MSGTHYTILGAVGASLAFLLGAQASGAAGVEVIPAWGWLLLGAANAAITFVAGLTNKGAGGN